MRALLEAQRHHFTIALSKTTLFFLHPARAMRPARGFTPLMLQLLGAFVQRGHCVFTGDCPTTCFGETCDYWRDNWSNCYDMEEYGCDCSGCMCGDFGECLLLDNVYCMEWQDSYHNGGESYYNDGDGGMGDASFSNAYECAAACANNPECTRGYWYEPSQYCYFFGIDGYGDTCTWADCGDDCTGFECEKSSYCTFSTDKLYCDGLNADMGYQESLEDCWSACLVEVGESLVAVDFWPNANEGGYYYQTWDTNCWCQDSCDSCSAWGEAVVDDGACPTTCYGASCDYWVQSDQDSSCLYLETMSGCDCSGCACGKYQDDDGGEAGGDTTLLAIARGFGVLPDSCSSASYSYGSYSYSFDARNLVCDDRPTFSYSYSYGTMSPTEFPANCFEIDSEDDGYYDIYPEGGDGDPVTVYCDMALGADYYKCDDCNDFWRYHTLSWSTSINSYSYRCQHRAMTSSIVACASFHRCRDWSAGLCTSIMISHSHSYLHSHSRSFDWHPNVGYLDGCGESVEKSNADSLQECWEKCENVDDTVGISWGYGNMCYCFTGGEYWYELCEYCVNEYDLNYGVAVPRGTMFPGDCDFADEEYQHSCPAGMDPIIPRSRGHWARSV